MERDKNIPSKNSFILISVQIYNKNPEPIIIKKATVNTVKTDIENQKSFNLFSLLNFANLITNFIVIINIIGNAIMLNKTNTRDLIIFIFPKLLESGGFV